MKKVLLLIVSFSLVLSGCGSQSDEQVETSTEGTIGSALTYEGLTISLDNAYYANFPHDGIEINFDRYLAADLTITNDGSDATVAKTLTNFTVVDENENLSRVMIDENKKKFSSNLMPGDSFEITLVFPVMDSTEFTMYYSAGASTAQENVLSWTFEVNDGRLHDVPLQAKHRDVGETVKTFLFGDGSNQIAWEYQKASETSEKTSEASEAGSEASEAGSEVTDNE